MSPFSRRRVWSSRRCASTISRSASALSSSSGRRSASNGYGRDHEVGVDVPIEQDALLPEREAPEEGLAGEALSGGLGHLGDRSEEHTSELQSLMRISYAVFCLKKKKTTSQIQHADYTQSNSQTTTQTKRP